MRWWETTGLNVVSPPCEPFPPNLKYICEIDATSGSGNLVSLQRGWASLQIDLLRLPGGCRNIKVEIIMAVSHGKLQEVVGRAFSGHRLKSWAKFNQISKS